MKPVSIIVWDPLVRLFHWIQLASFSVAFYTQEMNYELHLQSGYIILFLLAIRLMWGILGSKNARFSTFSYSPRTIFDYIKTIFNGQPSHYEGHNPIGALMVYVLLICMLIICLSGIALDAAENRSGPLANTQLFLYMDAIKTLHIASTYFCINLIVIHIIGVLVSSYIHKENLIMAMITGKKAGTKKSKQR